ncbi:MAG: AAA family ATPase [Dehalococcoidales bacterium]|nr:AAA family ATPase [Dehalococcoidales bacterium]
MESTRLVADVQRLRESLRGLPEPVAEPVLIVVSGLPGTGKSFFSRRLAERVPLLVLESDALRKALFSLPSHSAGESSQLFRAVHLLIEELLKDGISLVLDATNLSERFRERLYSIADRTNARLVMVLVEAPPEVVRQRLEDRAGDPEDNSDADWSVYCQMRPSVERISRNHYVIDTSRDTEPVIDKVVREIKQFALR